MRHTRLAAHGRAPVFRFGHGEYLRPRRRSRPDFHVCLHRACGAPGGSDIGVTASAIAGFFPGMIELDLQIANTTLPGVRTLFITTLNNDRAVATGMLEVK